MHPFMASRFFLHFVVWLLLSSISNPFGLETTAAESHQPVGQTHVLVAADDTATDELQASAIASGRQLFLEGSLQEAADVLQDVLASKHDEPTALMHLSDVLSHMGRPLQAVELADRLLGQSRLTTQARSFMLNRRGSYLASAGDWTNARQSYELAIETGGRGQAGMVNRHALYNLAVLHHFNLFRSETGTPDFSILERAIELYRAALGQNDTSPTAIDFEGPGKGVRADGIGGAIDRPSVFRHLAAALVLAGRPGEAISQIQRSLSELSVDPGTKIFKSCRMEGYGGGSVVGDKKGGPCDPEGAATAATTAAATTDMKERKKATAYLLDSLSGARSAAGDVHGAISAERMALSLLDEEPGLYHNMAVLLQKAGLLVEAREEWLHAVALDPYFSPAFTGLGNLEGAWGNVDRARDFYEKSLAALRFQREGQGLIENGGAHSHIGGRDAELVSMFLIATAVVPALYESRDHIAQVRRDFDTGLEQLLAEPMTASPKGVEDPLTTVGSGSLGYYIIYQGFEDVDIRRKLARAYWKFAPSLGYGAPFLEGDSSTCLGLHQDGEGDERATGGRNPPRAIKRLPDRSRDWPGEQIEWSGPSPADKKATSTAATTGRTETEPPTPTRRGKDVLRGSVPVSREIRISDFHRRDHANDDSGDNAASHSLCLRRRIRVGFLSAFFYHHSVGLLVEGVVTRLDRGRFETTAIFLQPHPTSDTDVSGPSAGRGAGGEESSGNKGEEVRGDDVYRAVRMRTEHVLDVPANSLAACRHAIASLELDVLVFTEIGINLESYFLSFARLARRSAVFWGHAVTSGVTAADAVPIQNGGPGALGGTDGRVADVGGADHNRLGGVDYFVSSWLFEDESLGRLAQRKYSERLYLMKGLTTRFGRPPHPEPGRVTREKLRIPPRDLVPTRDDPLSPLADGAATTAGDTAATGTGPVADPAGAFVHGIGDSGSMAASKKGHGTPSVPPPAPSSTPSPPLSPSSRPRLSSPRPLSCEALYLVPQTLYKLHPDFDLLVAGVLTLDQSGCVVFIQAVEASMTDGLARRISGTLSAAGVRPERVILVPQVGLSEFSGLVSLADVVLDPFPVGGGRSSFEILAVGTPIVMLYNRTSILQLTYGMYATMGLEGIIGSVKEAGSDAPVSLVTHTEDEFIRSAVAIATDARLNARVRGEIVANNHRLYEQDGVVREWEDFLEGIVSVPRPAHTEQRRLHRRHERRYGGLAVDASDFPAKLSWCSSVSSNNSNNDNGSSMPEASHSGGGAAPAATTGKEALGSGCVGDSGIERSDGGKRSHGNAATASDVEETNGTTRTTTPWRTTTIEETLEQPGSSTSTAFRAGPIGRDPGGIAKPTAVEADTVAAATAATAATALRADNRGWPSGGDSPSPPPPSPEVARHLSEMPRGSRVDVGVYPGLTAGVVDGGLAESGDIERREPLPYAIEFSMAPPREGVEPFRFLAEVFEGDDPMEKAAEIREEGALDYRQYRWVGAVLCRGVRRLQRPVVWSTYVQVEGGSRTLLEVHQGDELWQVARWHCRRYSLGMGRVAGLSAKLEKALPQHASREWLSSRAEDRSCSPPLSSTNILLLEGPPVSTDEGGHGNTNPTEAESLSTRYFSNTRGLLSGEAGKSREFHAAKGDNDVGGDGAVGVDSDNDNDDVEGRVSAGGCVTLAITTCKRLRAFLGTAEGLQALLGRLPQGAAEGAATNSPRVCQVLVVDDGSSPADRSLMLSAFPRFTYVFKGPADVKGHAGSMNLVLNLAKYRYLLYVEDDWWAVHDKLLPFPTGVRSFLWRAMEVLNKSAERVAQVLLNDQSTRSCSWGDTATCTANIQGTAGWARSTPRTAPLPPRAGRRADDPLNATAGIHRTCHHPVEECTAAADDIEVGVDRDDDGDSVIGNTTSSESERPQPAGDGRGVEYRLHEFGLLAPSHSFAHWPGFSLNPALWDLARLDGSYRQKYGRKLEFNPADIRFEQSMSMELSDAGVSVAFLPDVTFRHVGAGQSAYETNNMRRPWD